MFSLTRRDYRYMLGFYISISLSILVFFICFLPEFREYRAVYTMKREFAFLENNRQWYENYLKLKEEKELKANYLRSLECDIFYEDELNQLLECITVICNDTGTKMGRFTPGVIGKKEPYLVQGMQITVSGRYLELVRFLQRVTELVHAAKFGFTILAKSERLECILDVHVFLHEGKGGTRNYAGITS